MKFNRILVICISTLTLIVIGELGYYVYLQGKIDDKVIVSDPLKNSAITPSPIDLSVLTSADIASFVRSQSSDPLRLSYDDKNDRFFFDIPGLAYAKWRKTMKVDYDTWLSIGTLPKDRVESIVVTDKVRGVFSEPETNKLIEGKRYFQYTLTTKNGISMKFWESNEAESKTHYYKMVKGVEQPMKRSELKAGDTIVREGKTDLAKPPNDPSFFIEAKIVKL